MKMYHCNSFYLGVSINPIDDVKFLLFAPNQSALSEAEEMIKKLLEQSVG
jgi:hypothetical protein